MSQEIPHCIYLIPGFGADERLFSVIRPKGAEVRFISWVLPAKDDSLADYAKRLIPQIDLYRPFSLAGVSLGGMVAIELAKLVKADHIFLISSVKGRNEMPWYIGLARSLRLYKLFPVAFFQRFPQLVKPFFGGMSHEQFATYKAMLRNTDRRFLNWGQRAIVEWDNKLVPPNLVHIHGTADVIFPIRNIRNCIPVKGGSHYMIVKKGREISRIISSYINKVES